MKVKKINISKHESIKRHLKYFIELVEGRSISGVMEMFNALLERDAYLLQEITDLKTELITINTK